MTSSLPTPLRIAAGVVGTVADRVVSLPSDVPALGVSIAGHAVRLSLKARQGLADLAVRGDELLAGFRGAPPARPAWATFDEDEPVPAPAKAANAATVEPVASVAEEPTSEAAVPAGWEDLDELSVGQLRARIGELDAATLREVLAAEQAGRGRPAHLTLLHNRLTAAEAEAPAEQPASADEPETTTEPAAPDGWSDLGELSVGQLRDRIDGLDAAGLRDVLAAEQAGRGRPAHLTLLHNRLTTAEQQQ